MIVGIDIGTQSLKAVVIDENMKVLGEAAHSYTPFFPQPGWAEQDPSLWEEGLCLAVAGALQSAEVRPAQVKALGVAGQLDGCLPVGPDGTAHRDHLGLADPGVPGQGDEKPRRFSRQLARAEDL